MPFPKSVTKVKKNGVEFTSNVDRAKYTIQELTRAALKDTAKLIRRRILDKARKMRGMGKTKRIPNAFQYWVRRREGDLQIGVKHDTWYGADQELGTNNQPARHIIRDTVYENIDQIRIIQGQYLEAIEDENRARGLIDEEEEIGDEDN
ncbi:HK97 gp10 family phage protein [Neobacillus bataviensis]|uniref:HK97 gp10 family phage protein n=1 Tax=Neobacillus bataviensis TaxID=220685 RepID=A0A561DSS0_9BACI|nr:HK97-gp10 family putative phage morphogenesis protein [Neobacillus bataviensis]TWE06404.1 HK97 gp10 family phage protein [Neobacillus bataviensis]